MKTTTYIVIALTFLAIGCAGKKKQQTEEETNGPAHSVTLTDEQVQRSGIVLGEPERRAVADVVECTGKIDVPPDHRVSIFAPLPGFLDAVHVLPGEKVRKGQLLLSLHHPDYIQMQKQYIEQSAQLEFMTKEYERQKILAQENANARKTLEQTEAEFKSLKGQVVALEAQLRQLNLPLAAIREGKISERVSIVAPIDGYVSMFTANVGKYMRQDEEIFSIINKEHLHVELQVFEQDAIRMQVGEQVEFFIQGSSTVYEAYVKLVGEEIDPVSRTVNVHGHIEKDYPELKTGMYVNASIHCPLDTLPSLPEEAVVNNGKEYWAFLTADGRTFERVPVTTGTLHDGWLPLLGTLPGRDGYRWVVKGAYFLQAEMEKSSE